MEDFFTLERQEALRRAEYGLLHSQALRRVEREASMCPPPPLSIMRSSTR